MRSPTLSLLNVLFIASGSIEKELLAWEAIGACEFLKKFISLVP